MDIEEQKNVVGAIDDDIENMEKMKKKGGEINNDAMEEVDDEEGLKVGLTQLLLIRRSSLKDNCHSGSFDMETFDHLDKFIRVVHGVKATQKQIR